jgi:medium-chain acyl-[acyl-carrier-protein] hydrolase
LDGLPADLLIELDVWSVSLPGHTPGGKDVPFAEIGPLVDLLAEELGPVLRPPYAFFGHSLGALIGYEMACRMQAQGNSGPAHMIVSACRAPHLRDKRIPVHDRSDAEVTERLRELGGTPEEILENAELMGVLLPLVRADFALCERYEFSQRQPLDCSLTALSGNRDAYVTVEEVNAWRQQTSGNFSFQVFAGNHFFMDSSRSAVLTALAEDIRVVLKQI